MPIGLGMNHLEQEIAACQFWNVLIDAGQYASAWRPVSECQNRDLFAVNPETGASLEGGGFIEIEGDRVRLTEKAIIMLSRFSGSDLPC